MILVFTSNDRKWFVSEEFGFRAGIALVAVKVSVVAVLAAVTVRVHGFLFETIQCHLDGVPFVGSSHAPHPLDVDFGRSKIEIRRRWEM